MSSNQLIITDKQWQLLVDRVKSHQQSNEFRYLISVAGVPGAGKTTFANKMAMELSKQVAPTMVLSQDGFHLYRSELQAMPNAEEAIRRRGAPFTFNAKAFVSLVSQLKDKSNTVKAPSFDHKVKDPIEDDIVIDPSVDIVIIEGNYTSLKDESWADLSLFVDDTWFISTPESVVRSRIIKRHLEAGIANNEEEAIERADGSDLQNAKYIIENSKITNVSILAE
ncbi:Phosphoribulokinase / Uridine kinase family protein [Candida parapsilosis]|uniref:PRK domain-containing protein n=2 Tax=Candida parapsilosis TaxID=5480 RepID=G8B919_CANPC|nr:uncharacterized protein CPAR2_301070 [Candida parapsilosis]KAF6046122.1 Phosphoribulokinase / Uridine kinase family protein [Candida parapsilosis]KAF6046328.1 Phosphoribulokinase / Uridine kinase family protein [Candida parapsilosis]KAF6051231.1 Phosphoribulokinase / Uridine kinase family protein [Candida parapsilosis]KAF6062046.1 Phosphoribulokinase / Uridine kinase family protein [Candida parapsilosis]KAI5903142.1 Pantothenate kinase [Candida parapsilosis]